MENLHQTQIRLKSNEYSSNHMDKTSIIALYFGGCVRNDLQCMVVGGVGEVVPYRNFPQPLTQTPLKSFRTRPSFSSKPIF